MGAFTTKVSETQSTKTAQMASLRKSRKRDSEEIYWQGNLTGRVGLKLVWVRISLGGRWVTRDQGQS